MQTITLIQTQLVNRVLTFVGERGVPGTAFVIEYDGIEYLITADHLTNGDTDENVTLSSLEPTLHSGEGTPHLLSRVGDRTDPADIAVYRTEAPLGLPNLPLPIGLDKIALGQDVMVLGFPASRHASIASLGVDQAIVKRGVLSAISNMDGTRVIYLDIIANPGMSGSPVVFYNNTTEKVTVAAVLKGTVSQEMRPSTSSPSNTDMTVDEDPTTTFAGLSVATSIDDIRLFTIEGVAAA